MIDEAIMLRSTVPSAEEVCTSPDIGAGILTSWEDEPIHEPIQIVNLPQGPCPVVGRSTLAIIRLMHTILSIDNSVRR